MALTVLTISNAKPKDKVQKLFDSCGLFLEITPKGSKRWRHKYYYQGKEKLLSLGLYQDVSLAEAREILSEQKKQLAKGIDPSAARQAIESARVATALNQFEVVAREWFANKQPSWAASHAKVNLQRLERDVFPLIGDRGIADITAPEILSLLQGIIKRGSIETAHRVKSIISQVMRYGIATNRVDHDVTPGLTGALPPSPENHLAAITDPKRLGQVLKMFDAYPGGLVVRCALQLTPLLFVRPGELRAMKWAEVDLNTKEWLSTLSKTNQPHIVPLATQSAAILREIQPFTRTGEFVFPSPRTSNRPMANE
ncbi:integrase arm-type DNA-binding domain-containing protein [Thermosynechococcaceae cyanobacterium BACA0444]|uniref:Integrase arm-type DNA-binding domain-containing protein n=1 Tax=Pseudocalidococcus azoricus BACA0444 TaxID=2918990 RepID=A0AAE4JZU8_9CYAN|nr:integrase arm-type DNA-binding domain-containing protein [Pseudocalidococcus azoricus]MDS3861237.1 integrase arm-type DNA-binding domain-containing protein [Pseudocalidococcus azoricus BACA0444]